MSKECLNEKVERSCHTPQTEKTKELGDTIMTKVCTIIPPPEPISPTDCQLQIKKRKLELGVCFKPKPEPEPIVPRPYCLGICIEKVKNPPVSVKFSERPTVCVVEREPTTQDRCDAIEEANALHPDLPWPGCAPMPLPPQPPPYDLCEELRRKGKKAECKERMARYME